METRICKRCGQEKLIHEFPFRSDHESRRYECRSCKNERQSNSYFKRTPGRKRRLSAKPGYKICIRCLNEKLLEEFSLKHRDDPRYHLKNFRFCACKVCEADYIRDGKRNCPSYTKENNDAKNLMRKWGLTPEEYKALLDQQDGKCKICRSSEAGGKGRFHVDHDHQTGQFRALLCHKCNTGLGFFNDSPEILHKAIEYLKSHNQKEVSNGINI